MEIMSRQRVPEKLILHKRERAELFKSGNKLASNSKYFTGCKNTILQGLESKSGFFGLFLYSF